MIDWSQFQPDAIRLKRLVHEYQPILLDIANSKVGRFLLGADGLPIIHLGMNSYRQYLGWNRGRNYFRTTFFMQPVVAQKLMPIATKIELAVQQNPGFNQPFTMIGKPITPEEFWKRRIEAYAHFAGLEMKNQRYPTILLADSFNAGVGNGRCRNRNGNYTTCNTAGTGDLADYNNSGDHAIWTVNNYIGGAYEIWRSYYPHDTSALPDGDNMDSGYLHTYVHNKTDNHSGSIVIVQSTQASATSLATSDFGNVGGTSFGSKTLASISTGAYTDINLIAAGLAAISKTGYTLLATRQIDDINQFAPATDGSTTTQIGAYNLLDANAPSLSITHSAAAAKGLTLRGVG